ncbi:MAG: glycosyltransferase family 4 protein [Flavobacteriaceae bacterium]|nr:glycosyltransferase family 4 protein [Flavobacteriaceae bacterium]
MRNKLIRITTVPISLDKLLEGQLHFMTSEYDVIAVSSDKAYLEKIGTKETVATFPLEMTRKITPLQDFLAVVKLYFFLKKTKPFIVHTHTPKAGVVGMLASRMAGVPHRLHTVAGLPLLEATGLKRRLLDFVEKITYASATHVYPNSYGLLEIIKQNNYCKASKLKVIGNGSSNGIATSYFNPDLFTLEQKAALRTSVGIDEADFVFIFVGRLVKDKGINELISAFKKLDQEKTNVKLLLVGAYETDLDPLQNETIATIGSVSSIITVGYQNDVRPYFAISNALVFPSYREGFPNVVLQAGAMQLPAIVTDINGCNEIIKNAVNGIIIPVKNESAIYEAMFLLCSDATSYAALKANARQMIVCSFEQNVVWHALLEEYKSIST